jgi:hypothetical protein
LYYSKLSSSGRWVISTIVSNVINPANHFAAWNLSTSYVAPTDDSWTNSVPDANIIVDALGTMSSSSSTSESSESSATSESDGE